MPAAYLYLHPELCLSQGAKATGANVDRLLAVESDFANIGFPGSVCFPVGVGNVLTEHNSFTANAAFCHFDTSY